MEQEQFLNVIDRDEAERRFHAALDLTPLPAEAIALVDGLGRVLAENVIAPIDVPGFDRSNVDGFAVHAEDTFDSTETHPRKLHVCQGNLCPGKMPVAALHPAQALAIATGAVIPRGADAVVMVEHTDRRGDHLLITRPVTPGANITFAGTDIGRGELTLLAGEVLTSREAGICSALGLAEIHVVRRPRVAIVSTGDELIAPGEPLRPGTIYDSNGVILAHAVRELGGEPVAFGIVADDAGALREVLQLALRSDAVLLSGGTSKGVGDISYRVIGELGPPGIVAHGVALKPGKPLCLAAVRWDARTVPVVILPGFPASAIFTFHEFVAPVLRRLAGRRETRRAVVHARLPQRVNSERGRTEYLLVGLVAALDGLAAYPMGKGSGSVTTFSRADGFITIPRQREYLEAGAEVEVQLLSEGLQPADLVVMGSHCVGLDYLLAALHRQGVRTKFLSIGSSGGLAAVQRGECDLAGIHLLDPETNTYNLPFLDPSLRLIPGYARLQGIIFRQGDDRFENRSPADAVTRALADPKCILINRNRGSGTRVLIDRLLGHSRPQGHLTESRSHQAAAAAVAQGRADWGVAISTVAADFELGFLPLQEEQFDLVTQTARWDRPGVVAFRELLKQESTRRYLARLGFR